MSGLANVDKIDAVYHKSSRADRRRHIFVHGAKVGKCTI